MNVPPDLGPRIKAARIAAGLTQVELAGNIVSPGYLSRLEAGGRSPRMETLERLATALGVSPEALLTGQVRDAYAEAAAQVDHAELLLAGGELDACMQIAADFNVPQRLQRWPDLAQRARLVRALVCEARGELDEAIMELEDLMAAPAARHEPSVPAAIALARCYREAGDYDLAITCGTSVLDQLSELGVAGSPEALRLAVTVAGAQLQSGQVGVAMRTCLRAIKQAELIGSPEAAAAAYWNASAALRHSGALSRAHEFAARAMSILENGDSTRNLARLRVSLALLQLGLDDVDTDEIRTLLDGAHRELRGSPSSVLDRAHYQHAVTRLHLRTGDFASALAELDQVAIDEVADRSAEMACETSLLRAVTLLRAGTYPATQVEEAVSLADVNLRLLGQGRICGQMWFELAGAAREHGDTELAFRALTEAALTLGAAAPIVQSLDSPACSLTSAAEWTGATR